MIEIMNEQQVTFVNKMQEYNLSHEIDLKFCPPKLDFYLRDDGASVPPLESGLEAVCDPFLTTPSLVVPSSPSTLRANTVFIMTFPNPPFPLAQSMEYEVGETLGVSTGVSEG